MPSNRVIKVNIICKETPSTSLYDEFVKDTKMHNLNLIMSKHQTDKFKLRNILQKNWLYWQDHGAKKENCDWF